MSDLDAMVDVHKSLKDLREAATRVCVLSHILESKNPGKKEALLNIRTQSANILDALDILEA